MKQLKSRIKNEVEYIGKSELKRKHGELIQLIDALKDRQDRDREPGRERERQGDIQITKERERGADIKARRCTDRQRV